jgi:regulator of protease activity HflC (stomatin/prohibitin superfamily)
MQDALDEATDPWGVKAERVEMYVVLYLKKQQN